MQELPVEKDIVINALSVISEKGDGNKRNNAHHFIQWDRETQLKAFFDWLPIELHDVPGIDWFQLPPGVMGYCVHTVKNCPDAAHIAIATVSALGAVNDVTLLRMVGGLNRLFRILRSQCNMMQISDLHHQHIWSDYLTLTQQTEGIRKQLKFYNSVATTHYPGYLQRLENLDRLRMQAYALPSMPPTVLKNLFPHTITTLVTKKKRKAQSDILVPLYPVLRQLVCFRKQVAQRMLQTIREVRHQVETSSVSLPYAFEHTDTIPEINRDTKTVAEVEIQGRKVNMHFVLWDKPSWILHHPDRVSQDLLHYAKEGKSSCAPELNRSFVQFIGPTSDLLWFGDLVEHRLIQSFHKGGDQERANLARSLGFSIGCTCTRPGLMGIADQWFTTTAHLDGDCVFEPEALYRGILYGTALAMMVLSNGSRVSELLQVSCDKQRRITRTETVTVLGNDGQPLLDETGRMNIKQVKIHLQHLLPKGAKTDEERQLFPLSKESMRLFSEIKQLLEKTHGKVPVVYPSRSSTKYEHLKPEQYLFQWAANSDGTQGIICVNDVQVLLRFIFYGLDLYTAHGEPIRVSTHLLRHVMATHARQYRHVPKDVIAHFFLHHQLKALTGYSPSIPDLAEYYTQMTEEQKVAVIRVDLDEQEERDRSLMFSAPTLQDLQQMDENLRTSYEQWQALHPTAFGNCGCPGLCPRGYDRSLCIGCSYLVTDSKKMGAALVWRASYAKQAELLKIQGNTVDARQAHLIVQQLDDLINVMRLQLQVEADRESTPSFKLLPQQLESENIEG